MSDEKSQRRQPRFKVHLSVRFETALDFVTEYAENLSRGGLFISGAHDLELNREVPIVLELPGYEPFKVVARVVHVITPEMAEAMERKPGAGLSLTRGPKGFNQALRDYLARLGSRRDHTVLGGDEPIAGALEAAGYQSFAVETPAFLAAVVNKLQAPLLAVVVSRSDEAAYTQAAAGMGKEGIVHGIDYIEEIDFLLPELDAKL